jgi:hypothetical protein
LTASGAARQTCHAGGLAGRASADRTVGMARKTARSTILPTASFLLTF